MAKKAKSKSKPKTWQKKKFTMLILVALASLFLIYLSLSLFTNLNYEVAKIRCGHQPLIHITSFEPTNDYLTPDHPLYDSVKKDDWNNKYFCSEEQAQAAGYTKAHTAKGDKETTMQDTKSQFEGVTLFAPTYLPDGTSLVSKSFEDLFGEVTYVEVFQYKDSKFWSGMIYQGPLHTSSEKSYDACSERNTVTCHEVTATTTGNIVYKNQWGVQKVNRWSIKNEKSYITITDFGDISKSPLNDQNVVQIFNGLHPISN